MIRILIGGDVCPMGSMERFFIEGDAPAIFHDLLDEIGSADVSIVNLECPLVSKKTPINKAGGEVLGAAGECIRGFSAAKWHLLNLANNHSFDHGVSGLTDTIQTIRSEGLGVIGAGANIEEAKAPFVTTVGGQRIVIYSMAEREYSIADETNPGANPLDLINFVEAIQLYKQGGVFVVLLHGGTESSYPTPEMMRRCRFMVDMGADAVICSHPHRPLPWETYREKPIVYGMGNFVFEELHNPLQNPPAGWHEGYLAKLTIQNGAVAFVPIPYFQCKPVLGAVGMDAHAQGHFLSELQQRSDRLKDTGFLRSEWLRFCERGKEQYLAYLFGDRPWKRKLSAVFGYSLHSDDDLRQALLMSQCETHLEVLNTFFRDMRIRDSAQQ